MAANYNNGYYGQPYNGAQYASQNLFGAPGYSVNQTAPPKLTSTLTEEQIKQLQNTGDSFSLQLTEEDILRGVCVHRYKDGSSALIDNPDGSSTCRICQHNFYFGEYKEEEVKEATDIILNILQTTKLLYLDMPDQAAKEYYQIIPLIAKIPKLFKIAADNFRRHDNIPGFVPGQSMNPFMIFGAMTSPGGFQYAPVQQPGYQGYGYGVPQMNQPMYGQPQPPFAGGQQIPPMGGYNMPGANAFGYPGASDPNMGYGYGAQQPAYAPQTQPQQGYQVQQPQQQPQNQTAPTSAPIQQNTTTDGKEVQVNAKFTS